MDIKTHVVKNLKIAEIISNDVIINNPEDSLDLLGNLYYEGFDSIIIHEKNFAPAFFDLKTGLAGEILQKFSTYRVKLVIVGDFEKYQKKSMKSFILESNKNKQINFVSSESQAIAALS